jgi:hypothetical protein
VRGETKKKGSRQGRDRESGQSVGCEPSSDEINFTSESETRIIMFCVLRSVGRSTITIKRSLVRRVDERIFRLGGERPLLHFI